MRSQEDSEIVAARELLRQFEVLEEHKERLQKFEEALDLLNSCIEENECSKSCQVASNLKTTYLKKLIYQLPSLNTLDIDDWSAYIMFFLMKAQQETDAICDADKTLKSNYQSFISIWASEFIRLLENHLPRK